MKRPKCFTQSGGFPRDPGGWLQTNLLLIGSVEVAGMGSNKNSPLPWSPSL